MYCRNCGNEVNEQAVVCIKCGMKPLAGNTYCYQCGEATNEKQEICIKCGVGLGNLQINRKNTSINNEWNHIPTYYKDEFIKIKESNEIYKGSFNAYAFLGGAFWAFTKGLWVWGIIAIITSMLTAGIAGIMWWIVFGVRGTYMYYNYVVKNQHLGL